MWMSVAVFTDTAQSPLRTDVWTGSTRGCGKSCRGGWHVRLLALTGQGVPVWWQSHHAAGEDRQLHQAGPVHLLANGTQPSSAHVASQLKGWEREPHCGL